MIDQKLIVFHSSPDFSDNPRALYDYVVDHTDYVPFWVISDERAFETLSAKGIPCGYEKDAATQEKIATARYLVSSSFEFAYGKKRGQIHVSAWHGFGPKVVGFFDSATTSVDVFEALDAATTQSDIIAVPSRSSQIITSGMFAIDPRKALITGFARNDYLFTENGRKCLETLFGGDLVEGDASFVFYLPTMRRGLKAEGAQFEQNVFNYQDYDPAEIDAFLESHNAYIVGKLHFADNDLVGVDGRQLPRRMLFLRNEDLVEKQLTIYHLLNGFNALITDYSSVYADFLLLDRPIVFSCPDFDEYRDDRGFIADDPRFMMPGAFVRTQGELLERLEAILGGTDAYKERRDRMMPFFHTYVDGESSSRLFDAMVRAGEEGIPDCHKDFGALYVGKDAPLSQYVSECFVGEVFFDCGTGYSEENKVVCPYALEDMNEESLIRIEFELPSENVVSLRFDPDRSNRVVLQDLVLRVGEKRFGPTGSNGIETDGKTVFLTDDPQMHFDDVRLEGGRFASLELKASSFISEGPQLLVDAGLDRVRTQGEPQSGLLSRARVKVFGRSDR